METLLFMLLIGLCLLLAIRVEILKRANNNQFEVILELTRRHLALLKICEREAKERENVAVGNPSSSI